MKMDDLALKKAVQSELNWEPSIEPAEIGVAAKDGIVTLSGHVRSYWEKVAAERAALRVAGVKAVVNEMDVRLPGTSERTDQEIAGAVLDSLKWNVLVPPDRIKVKVLYGWVTLEGVVEWQFQKSAAEKAVRRLLGVRGVANLMEVKLRVSKGVVKSAIEDALRRNAELDARRIKVEVEGDAVILRGTVGSRFEREEAERAAWRAPGVRSVYDEIMIGAAAAVA
jgi:osmotically-inducible protein OsmY